MNVTVRTAAGADAGQVDLADDVFGIEPNVAVMHQVVTAQLANARSGTHSTKTRAEVSGGGAKPWRQKGTGHARQGSIRAPHWRGGGIAHGPKPRDYRQRTPKKMIRLALRSALSDRASENKIVVIDDWALETPRTKDALAALAALGLRTKGEREDRLLIVLDRDEEGAWKSFRNLGKWVQMVLPEELNTYDILVNDWLVFSAATLATLNERFTQSTEGEDSSTRPDPVAVSEPGPERPAPKAQERDDEVTA